MYTFDVCVFFCGCCALTSARYERELANVLQQPSGVTCTASSEFEWYYSCMHAYDGIKSPGGGREWVSKGEGDGAWINITFASPVTLYEVKLWQRCYYWDQYQRFNFEFSGREQETMSDSCRGLISENDHKCYLSPTELSVDHITTTFVTILGDDDCTSQKGNGGIVEVELYGVVHEWLTTPDLVCSASSEYNESYTCDHAYDGVNVPGLNNEWVPLGEKEEEVWIKIDFLGPVVVSGFYIWKPCVFWSRTWMLVFSDGTQQEFRMYYCNEDYYSNRPMHRVVQHVLTTSVKIVATECQSETCLGGGIREIQIYGKKVVRELLTRHNTVSCTASSQNHPFQGCTSAYDTDNGRYSDWLSSAEDHNVWIRLQFPEMVIISDISLRQPCHLATQSANFKFVFMDGSTRWMNHICGADVDEDDCDNIWLLNMTPWVHLTLSAPVLTSTVTVFPSRTCVSTSVSRGIKELQMYGRRLVPFVTDDALPV